MCVCAHAPVCTCTHLFSNPSQENQGGGSFGNFPNVTGLELHRHKRLWRTASYNRQMETGMHTFLKIKYQISIPLPIVFSLQSSWSFIAPVACSLKIPHPHPPATVAVVLSHKVPPQRHSCSILCPQIALPRKPRHICIQLRELTLTSG